MTLSKKDRSAAVISEGSGKGPFWRTEGKLAPTLVQHIPIIHLLPFLIVSIAPVPRLHVPRGHEAAPPELPKQRRGRHRPHGNLEVTGSQPHTPGKYLFAEEGQMWQRRPPLCFPPLRLLSEQPVAFSSDFNLQIALKHCRKQHGNFFLMMVTKAGLCV